MGYYVMLFAFQPKQNYEGGGVIVAEFTEPKTIDTVN